MTARRALDASSTQFLDGLVLAAPRLVRLRTADWRSAVQPERRRATTRSSLLFVGDDRATILTITRWMAPHFSVVLTTDCSEALRLVDDGHDLGVLVTDLGSRLVHTLGLISSLRDRGHRLAQRAVVYTLDPSAAGDHLSARGLDAHVVDKSKGLGALRDCVLRMRDLREWFPRS